MRIGVQVGVRVDDVDGVETGIEQQAAIRFYGDRAEMQPV